MMGTPGGNCGQDPNVANPFYCMTLDSGGDYLDEANFVSASIDSYGLISVAYFEADSYNYSSNLKLAIQQFPSFLPLNAKH